MKHYNTLKLKMSGMNDYYWNKLYINAVKQYGYCHWKTRIYERNYVYAKRNKCNFLMNLMREE